MSDIKAGMALYNNSYVIDFIEILEQSGRREAAQDFQALAEQVSRMESQLDAATREISTMRRELAELRDFYGEPLHNTARQSLDAATRQIGQAKEKLGAIKDKIVQGAKYAVTTVKEKGIGALNSAVSFLGVREDLESLRESLDKNTKSCDRSLARVDAISRQYHEVGTATRNFGRAITGKDIQDDTRDSGKLSKVAAAPFHVVKKLYTVMAKGIDTALDKLAKLDRAAKPSMLENLQALKETTAKESGMALSPEKKPKENSL